MTPTQITTVPLQLEITRATDFLRVGAEGRFNLAASEAALTTVAGACRKRGIQHAAFDLRSLQRSPTPMLTPTGLVELVRTVLES